VFTRVDDVLTTRCNEINKTYSGGGCVAIKDTLNGGHHFVMLRRRLRFPHDPFFP